MEEDLEDLKNSRADGFPKSISDHFVEPMVYMTRGNDDWYVKFEHRGIINEYWDLNNDFEWRNLP